MQSPNCESTIICFKPVRLTATHLPWCSSVVLAFVSIARARG